MQTTITSESHGAILCKPLQIKARPDHLSLRKFAHDAHDPKTRQLIQDDSHLLRKSPHDLTRPMVTHPCTPKEDCYCSGKTNPFDWSLCKVGRVHFRRRAQRSV